MHVVILQFFFVLCINRWAYFQEKSTLCNNCIEKGGFVIFEGVPIFERLWSHIIPQPFEGTLPFLYLDVTKPGLGLVALPLSLPPKITIVWGWIASYPGSRWTGKERAWYPLFAHALNSQKSWEIVNYHVISVQP